MGRNLRIGYLSQKPEFANKITALEAALPLKKDIADSPANYEPQAKNMMNKLGFKNHTQPIEELSGGQRKRIALIRTLLTPADILILDEPTNHLDSAMNEWLEDYLKKYRGALIMITHDRYFLDTVVNRIVEIDKGKLYSYECNYLGFLERKAQREEIANAGLERDINQYFAVITDMRSVGVMGDGRTYDYTLALRAVTTTDFMTADWARIPFDVLEKASNRIVNEVKHVNRLVYDITSKPPATIEWE